MNGVFIFRRDLRLRDNIGLLRLLEKVDSIIPVFLLDPRQASRTRKNRYYFSENALQFMCESLIDLNKECRGRLQVIYGDPSKSLERLIKKYSPAVVGWNSDWSSFAMKRDEKMKKICVANNVEVLECMDDFSLHPMELLKKEDGKPYRQFGAFYAHEKGLGLPEKPVNGRITILPSLRKKDVGALLRRMYDENDEIAQRGGRAEAVKKLRELKRQKQYDTKRDRLDFQTSNLSASLNFGCVSVREAYYAMRSTLGSRNQLMRQLYWRDFFLAIVAFEPRARSYVEHMDPGFDRRIRWRTKGLANDFKKLWDGKTGFLLIDAAMMQMRRTGFMHNRARMLVVIFWTKYLRIHILHPKYGSQAGFSRALVDAIGPSQNKMNHHWATELDMPGRRYAPKGHPYAGRPMDVSNKMIGKWDPDGVYIRKWLPHLKDVSTRDLRSWDDARSKSSGNIHPAPIFDARERYQVWIFSSKARV